MDGWNFYQSLGSATSSGGHAGSGAMAPSAPGSVGVPRASAAASAPAEETAPSSSAATWPGTDALFAAKLHDIYSRLRPYQRELFRKAALQDSIVYLPTGGGKTWVAAALLCYQLAIHRGTRVLFAARSVALADQQATVLRELLGVPVVCVTGGAKEVKSAQAFLSCIQYRVAVFTAVILARWIGECPEMISKGITSMVVLDEVHHARAGEYELLCEQLHSIRGGGVDIGVGDDDDVYAGDGDATDDAEARLYAAGRRSPDAVVLGGRLRTAVNEEHTLHAEWQQLRASVPVSDGISSSVRGGGGGDGIGVRVESPVLDLMLSSPIRDTTLPHLVGLSASPVVNFTGAENSLVRLLVITRSRLIGVVEERADLQQHLPQPALVALSFLPLFGDRVLKVQLRSVIVALYPRITALIVGTAEGKKLGVLPTTSIMSASFAVQCDQVETSKVLSPHFVKTVRLPRRSALVAELESFQAQVLHRRQTIGEAVDSTSTASRATSVSSWVRVEDLQPAEEAQICLDFISSALRLMKCVSLMLIALETESQQRMAQVLWNSYPPEELDRMRATSLAMTSVVLRPILGQLFCLVYAVTTQHEKPNTIRDNGVDAPAAPVPSSPGTTPSTAGAVTLSDATMAAAVNTVPASLRCLSTRTQVFMRLFAELALLAVTMASSGASTSEGSLRVLAFVDTRQMAAYLMEILHQHSPWTAAVLRPAVLLGQGSGKGPGKKQNSMTRPQQLEVLERLRSGTTHLVFATTVAEEGIDVPACHVVLRCSLQTEMRSIIQCCGRLRMKKTLFLSLSNLLDGNPRLGFVLGAVRKSEAVLRALARRSVHDTWCLAQDSLVDGADRDNPASADGSTSEWDGAASPTGAASAVSNSVGGDRSNWEVQSLQFRHHQIIGALQRLYEADVFCVERRDLAGSSVEEVRCTVLLSVPTRAAAVRGHMTSPAMGRGRLHTTVAGSAEAVRWVRVCGVATGGSTRAYSTAFAEFCRSAERLGMLGRGGQVVEMRVFEPSPDVPDPVGMWGVSAMEPLSQSATFTYATARTPSVILLGNSLCLCRRTTLPPEVLVRLFSECASVMAVYTHDLWSSRIEPQSLLLAEVKDAGMPAPAFTRGHGAHKGGGADVGEDTMSSCTGLGASESEGSRATVSYSGTLTGSREWYKARHGSEAGRAHLCLDEVEVRFRVPQLRVGVAAARAMHTTTTTPTAGAQSRARMGECDVVQRDVVIQQRSNDGAWVSETVREIRVSHRGPYAVQVVSLAALRLLDVCVVHGVTEEQVVEGLQTCRHIPRLGV
ncbi:Helicase-like protein, putative Type III restriction enzyme [Novymonas esmeraldas]|uniref:Helicase-like protein, putative Type III restriction enzyme n=1 Tax=Novymonas esmeraldas TaxID=1808958 RepID=A0AAW0EPI6_9TRYP